MRDLSDLASDIPAGIDLLKVVGIFAVPLVINIGLAKLLLWIVGL